MDYKDAEKVLEICEKATPGPWEWQKDTWNGGYSGLSNKDGESVVYPSHCNDGDDGAAWFDDYLKGEDAQFIALARTALPYWVDRARQLEAESAAMREALEEIRTHTWHQVGVIANHVCPLATKALDPSAGRDLLERVQRLEAALVKAISYIKPHHALCANRQGCNFISAVTGQPDCIACDEWQLIALEGGAE